MEKKSEVKIKSKLPQELSTGFEIGGEKYLVMTEDARPHIVTNVYLGGKVVKTEKTDYTAMLKAADLTVKLRKLIEKQHNKTVDAFKKQKSVKAPKEPESRGFRLPRERKVEVKSPSDYLEDIKSLLARKNFKNAMLVLSEGLEKHPGEPFLLSYYGCLDAVVNKKYKRGIATCLEALKSLKKRLPFGQEFYLPTLYLNLGRAYLAADNKNDAIDAFNTGLNMDPENKDLLWELKKLGTRKAPPITFLKRSNPINKYIGMFLHKMRN